MTDNTIFQIGTIFELWESFYQITNVSISRKALSGSRVIAVNEMQVQVSLDEQRDGKWVPYADIDASSLVNYISNGDAKIIS